jgi:hypothetical protein
MIDYSFLTNGQTDPLESLTQIPNYVLPKSSPIGNTQQILPGPFTQSSSNTLPGQLPIGNTSASGFDFAKLLADPNMQQLLAQIGAKIGGQGSVGEAIGTPTSQIIGQQQFQKAAGKQQSQQNDLWQSILGAIQGGDTGKLFTDGTDMNGLNSLTIDSKGINLKGPNPFAAPSFGAEQESLESGTSKNGGGKDYSPFFRPLLG